MNAKAHFLIPMVVFQWMLTFPLTNCPFVNSGACFLD